MPEAPAPVETAAAEPAAPSVPAVSAAPRAADPGPTEDELLARYKAMLLERIGANKRYPAMARRRGIEGDVRLRLRIDSAGQLAGLDTLGRSPLVLAKEARVAGAEGRTLSSASRR